MDALEKLHFVARFMNTKQWEEYIATEDYLWSRARIEGYQGAHMERLIAAGRRKTAEAWEIALDMATKIIAEELASIPSEVRTPNRQQLVQEFAEQLLRDQDIIPPTYSKKITCENCGPMMSPESYETETTTCPWCAK